MATIFTNSGKKIQYKGTEFEIIESGISSEDEPYVHLKPENKELAQRMCDEIRKRGDLTIWIDGTHRLVLGKDEFPYC